MSDTDPLSILSNPPSTVVKVQGTARDDVNGKLGIAVQFSKERGRYSVHMVDTQTTMALKPPNLVKASTMESYMAQAKQVYKDPRIRKEVTKYYNLAQSKLGGVKPEYAGAVLLIAVIAAMYFVGFSKTLMVVSMLMMVGLVIAPDLIGGASPKVIATRFPRRCRETIEQSAPMLQGKLNDNVAAALVVGMLAVAGRSLFISPQGQAAAAASASYAASQQAAGDMADRHLMDDSEPTDYSSGGGSSAWDKVSGIFGSLDNPPPVDGAPKPRKNFGFKQVMSLLYIWRTVKELGRDPGTGSFNYELALANARMVPPWKLGIFAFTCYTLVSHFL